MDLSVILNIEDSIVCQTSSLPENVSSREIQLLRTRDCWSSRGEYAAIVESTDSRIRKGATDHVPDVNSSKSINGLCNSLPLTPTNSPQRYGQRNRSDSVKLDPQPSFQYPSPTSDGYFCRVESSGYIYCIPSSPRLHYLSDQGSKASKSRKLSHTTRLPSVKELFPVVSHEVDREGSFPEFYDYRERSQTFNSQEIPSFRLNIDHDEVPRQTGPKCAFTENCATGVPLRRIVSHYFGRNKKETRAIPDDMWVFYCRQHYQRSKYRQKPWDFARTQMDLVKATVRNLEAWGEVIDFTINLRKRAVEQLQKEDACLQMGREARMRGEDPPGIPYSTHCPERWLVPYVGQSKTFPDVYTFIDLVSAHAKQHRCKAAEFELVPNIKPQLTGARSSRFGTDGRTDALYVGENEEAAAEI